MTNPQQEDVTRTFYQSLLLNADSSVKTKPPEWNETAESYYQEAMAGIKSNLRERIAECDAASTEKSRERGRPVAAGLHVETNLPVSLGQESGSLSSAGSRGSIVSPGTPDYGVRKKRSSKTQESATNSTVTPSSAMPYIGLPNVKKRKTSGSEPSTTSPVSTAGCVTRSSPDWYAKINPEKVPVSKQNRTCWDQLKKIRILLTECDTMYAKTGTVTEAHMDIVRKELHRLEYTKVDEYSLAVKRLLDNGKGLAQIFDPEFSKGVKYPWDIAQDAEMLYNKWCQRFFDPDLIRGLNAAPKKKYSKEKSAEKNAWSMIQGYDLRVDASFYGNGHLVNGQWWPRQVCAMRDGAHGEMQAGIHGPSTKDAKKGLKGAFSVVMSGHEYTAGDHGDEDNGDEVWYCGTRSNSGAPSESTQQMLDAVNSGRPVRLMRSSGLPAGNKFKPVEGFRYDGLYDVVDKKLVDPAACHYKFLLQRRAGQPPIRATGVEARPTERDLEEWHKLQKQLGMKGTFA